MQTCRITRNVCRILSVCVHPISIDSRVCWTYHTSCDRNSIECVAIRSFRFLSCYFPHSFMHRFFLSCGSMMPCTCSLYFDVLVTKIQTATAVLLLLSALHSLRGISLKSPSLSSHISVCMLSLAMPYACCSLADYYLLHYCLLFSTYNQNVLTSLFLPK